MMDTPVEEKIALIGINLPILLLTIVVDQFYNHFYLGSYLEELGHLEHMFSNGFEVVRASLMFLKDLRKFGPLLTFYDKITLG